ncbi:MAG TPA: NAD(P)/FAD-dependent oxidoreductase [Myxococcota bacterium]|nr:NAD(P)/FAD-dependent oxidoreductase [Myxococcota bacterium]
MDEPVEHPHRKERYWSKRAPDDRAWDTIVIGSGIGGMTTAALLAKLGERVLVLEQHYVPGGFTHVFRRQGYEWDVGVHIVGEASRKALPGRLMSLVTDDRLQWAPVGPVYDEFWFPDGFSIAFPDSPAAFADTLKSAFPGSGREVDAYLAETRATVKSMRSWYIGRALPGALGRWLGGVISNEAHQRHAESAAAVVGRLIRDPKLQTVVNAQWGYHGSPPAEVSWGLQAMTVRHFLHGANYPVGGASRIAPAFLRTVADAGGWTRIVADVAQILVEGGRATGVRMADGEEIRAKRVVSAAGAWSTATRLLPPEHREAGWVQSVASHAPAPAHVCLYLGFKGDIAAAGATRQCQWYYRTWSHERALWDVHPDRPVGDPSILFTSFPSLKDPLHDPGPEQRHTGEMITFVPWEPWQRWADTRWRRRGEDYDAFKQQIAEKMLEGLFSHHPQLRGMLDYWELSTPLTTDLFARPYHGSIYGLAGTPDRYADRWLRPQTPIPGLWMSGSDVSSCGVVGAMMGGALCALAMEPMRGLRLLRAIA